LPQHLATPAHNLAERPYFLAMRREDFATLAQHHGTPVQILTRRHHFPVMRHENLATLNTPEEPLLGSE
jgi:hypothetical protein